jgi:hypothetical protein
MCIAIVSVCVWWAVRMAGGRAASVRTARCAPRQLCPQSSAQTCVYRRSPSDAMTRRACSGRAVDTIALGSSVAQELVFAGHGQSRKLHKHRSSDASYALSTPNIPYYMLQEPKDVRSTLRCLVIHFSLSVLHQRWQSYNRSPCAFIHVREIWLR